MKVFATITAALLLMSLPLSAESKGGKMKGEHCDAEGSCFLKDKTLGLSADQTTKIKALCAETKVKTDAVELEVKKLKEQIAAVKVNNDADQAKLRELQEKKRVKKDELRKLHQDCHDSCMKLLTEEQKKKVWNQQNQNKEKCAVDGEKKGGGKKDACCPAK